MLVAGNGEKERSLRAFLAIEPAASVRDGLVSLKRELAMGGFPVRWVPDDALHATVRFFGRIPPDLLAGVRQALTQIVPSVGRIPARIGGLGAFPNQRRPRVIWVGLSGEALPELFRCVESALAPLGLGGEALPQTAHITLGRVRRGAPLNQLTEIFNSKRIIDFGVCVIHELIAYQSQLSSKGSVYTKLWTVPFREHTGGQAHGS